MSIKDQLLQRIKESVVATAPDAKLVLFGSYARGTNTKDSDIDLLILLDKDKFSWPEEKGITYPLYDIEFETVTLLKSARWFCQRRTGNPSTKLPPFIRMLPGKALYYEWSPFLENAAHPLAGAS
jgi:predicted nucleotidyltransferase